MDGGGRSTQGAEAAVVLQVFNHLEQNLNCIFRSITFGGGGVITGAQRY